jgi:T5orf172 domain
MSGWHCLQGVYFAGIVGGGPVKIGVSSAPETRAREVGWSIHRKTELLASLPGGQALERRFHLQFLDDWIGREWFNRSAAIDETIEAIRAGTFDPDTLPPKRSLPRSLLWQQVASERFESASA